MAAGRLTRQIREELDGLEDAVRRTPGFGDDADEALRDTIDALNGFCRAELACKNPPVLPTDEEIKALPVWAQVAFGARCARRVVAVFRCKWPDAPQHIQQGLVQTVEVVEKLAGTTGRGDKWVAPAAALAAAAYVCDAAITAGRDRARSIEVVEAASTVITKFKDHAANLADPLLRPIAHNTSVGLANGIATSHETYAQADLTAKAVIRRDFDHLADLARSHHWTDDTPVPPEVFGPLWPEGPPDGWPADPDVPQRTDLALEILSRPRRPQMTEDDTVNLFNAINAYYIARTGNRLTMEDLRPLIAAAVPAEV